MCVYCENERIIIRKDVISDFNWGWGGASIKITENEASKYPLGILIDRRYLRLVDLEDYNCLDGGDKIKINFCPFCGNKLKEE